MAVIPLYQQQTSAQGAFNPSVGPDGGAIGASIQRIGSALDSVGEASAYALRQQELNTAKTWSGNAVSKASVDWTTDLEKRKAAAKPGAPNFAPDFLDAFDKYAASTAESAPDEMSRRFVQQHLMALRTSLGDQAVRWQAGQQVAYNVNLSEQAQDNWARVVQQDPSQYPKALQALRETMPYPGAIESQKLDDRARKLLTSAAASQVLDSDPGKMLEYTGKALGENGFTGKVGVPWIDDASADQIKAWNQQATVKVAQAQGDAERQLAQQLSDARKAVAELQTFTLEGRMPDDGYIARVKAAVNGFPELSKTADDLIGQAMMGAAFGSQPLPAQKRQLETLQGQPTNPESAKIVAHAQSVYNTQTEQAKADPWAAGSKFWRLPEAPEVQIGNPETLVGVVRSRAAAAPALEAATGFPVSPLRPNEANQAVTMLQSLPISVRAEVLGRIGMMLNPKQIDALSEQIIGKDRPLSLSLLLGADRTTAGRGAAELVQLGAQALTDKTVKKDDTALAGWRAEISTMVRGTLGNPKDEQNIIDAAYYVRAAQELESVAPAGYTLKSGADRAVAMVAGLPVSRAGTKALLPRGMDESAFDAKAQSALAPMAGQTFYVRGQPVTAESLANRWTSYGLRMDGQGGYIPVMNNALVTMDKAGTMPLRVKVQ